MSLGTSLTAALNAIGADIKALLSGKVDTTRTVAGKPLSSDITLVKGDVGLSNVDNTSDATKPVSTAMSVALADKATAAQGAKADAAVQPADLGSIASILPYDPVTRPWYLDTFWTVFRGMSCPAAQLTDGTSNSTLTAGVSFGAASVTVANGVKFVRKEPIVIAGAGDGGTDLITEVITVTGNVLSIRPPVLTTVTTGATVTSLWINAGHLTSAGFGAWATVIAGIMQSKVTPGVNLFPQGSFTTAYTDTNGVANIPVGMESIGAATFTTTNYTPAEGSPFARIVHGTSMGAASGAGVRTLTSIKVTPGDPINVSVMIGGAYLALTVVDKDAPGTVLASGNYTPLSSYYTSSMTGSIVGPRQWAQFNVPANVTDIEVRIISEAGSGAGFIDDLRVIRSRQDGNSNRPVIEDPRGRAVVMMGDSWGNGFTGAIALQAALEARIGGPITFINACIAGQRLDQMVARFTTDAAAHNPLYVLWEWGVNDVNAGYSTATMVANMKAANEATRAIGAIPVHLGIPASAANLTAAHDGNERVRAAVDDYSL